MSVNMNVFNAPGLGDGAAAQLPGQQVLHLLDDDRLGRAGEHRLAELLVVHAGDVHQRNLRKFAG
jgi:hypothetical protein